MKFFSQSILIASLAGCVVLADDKNPAYNADITAFCAARPTGLYCDPRAEDQKIECPSGNVTVCPGKGPEICQERGVLKQYGYKGGIARCVPNLGAGVLSAFCSTKTLPGTYCFGDNKNNIRIACPSGNFKINHFKMTIVS